MSEQSPPEKAVMDANDTFNIVIRCVYATAFFTKLAGNYNIQPTTDAEALDLLDLAGQIRKAEKKAGMQVGNTSIQKQSKVHLSQELGAQCMTAKQKNHVESQVKQVASYSANDTELAKAIYSLHMQGKADS